MFVSLRMDKRFIQAIPTPYIDSTMLGWEVSEGVGMSSINYYGSLTAFLAWCMIPIKFLIDHRLGHYTCNILIIILSLMICGSPFQCPDQLSLIPQQYPLPSQTLLAA